MKNQPNTIQQTENQPVQTETFSTEEALERRKNKLTFGQSLMEKVKKFFEEVE